MFCSQVHWFYLLSSPLKYWAHSVSFYFCYWQFSAPWFTSCLCFITSFSLLKFTILKLIFKRICNRLLIECFYEISLKAFSDNLNIQFTSVQSLSRVQLFATPWIAAYQAFLSITISQSSLKFTSIESVMPSSHLILCRPLFLLVPC